MDLFPLPLANAPCAQARENRVGSPCLIRLAFSCIGAAGHRSLHAAARVFANATDRLYNALLVGGSPGSVACTATNSDDETWRIGTGVSAAFGASLVHHSWLWSTQACGSGMSSIRFGKGSPSSCSLARLKSGVPVVALQEQDLASRTVCADFLLAGEPGALHDDERERVGDASVHKKPDAVWFPPGAPIKTRRVQARLSGRDCWWVEGLSDAIHHHKC